MGEQDLAGGCACGEVRYELDRRPMFVHCCHCRWCQRETGSAFVLNGLIERSALTVIAGEPQRINIPSESGSGQDVFRCPRCQVALWSHYGAAGDAVAFVRLGTLDHPDACPPDIHIFTDSKQPWVLIPDGANASEAYYRRSTTWPEESIKRYNRALGRS
ncbi:MAG: GFA family protein [Pseudomonadota bacterium]